MRTSESKEKCGCETRVIVLPPHSQLSQRLFSIDHFNLRDFNRFLLEKAGDESSPEGVAFMITLAISRMPSSIRGLILNKLSQIIRALVDTEDHELVTDIRLHVNRLLVIGV